MEWLLKLVLGPALDTLVKWRQAELAAKGQHENHVEAIALKTLELDAREAELNNQAKSQIRGKWYEPENLFAYGIAFPYWFTAVTIDFVIAPALGYEHVTLPLKGETAVTMGMIMGFWFGKRMITSIGGVIAQAFAKR